MRPVSFVLLVLSVLLVAVAPALAQTNVPAGTISVDTTWNLAGSPYIVKGTVTIQGTDGPDGITTLTIEPGVVVQFDERHDLQIGVSQPGALIADGNAAGGPATIVFTASSAAPTAPFWDGLLFGAQARSSIIRNAVVEYSGRGTNFKGAIRTQAAVSTTITIEDVTIRVSGDANGSGLFIAGGTVQAADCSFEANASYDVRLSSGTGFVDDSSFESVRFDNANATVTFSGNTVTNWGTRLSRLTADAAARFPIDNTVSSIAGANTEIVASTQNVDGTWSPALGVYLVLGNITVQGTDGADGRTTLTVEGSTEVRMANFAVINVGTGAPGSLIVDGDTGVTPGTVLFTSSQAAPVGAVWGGLWLRTQSGASTLRNLIVEHAGRGGGVRGAVQVSSSSATAVAIDRLTVRENGNGGTAGLYLEGGTNTITASVFENNAYYDLQLANGSGAFTSSTFSSVRFEFLNPPYTFFGCTMPNWGALVSRITADAAARLAPDNTVTAVPGAITEIGDSSITVDAEFGPEVGTYRPFASLNISGTAGADGVTTLTLLPGTRVEFDFGAGLNIGTLLGEPGRIVTAPGAPAPVLTAKLPGAGVAFWSGVRVESAATASLEGLAVEFGTNCLDVRGVLDAARDLSFKRCSLGMSISNNTPAFPIERLRCNTTDICVRSTSAEPVIRESELIGSDFGVQNTTPGTVTVDARENWWGDPTGPSGEGSGAGSRVSEGVLFDPWLSIPPDDGDGALADDGDGIADPCTSGTTVDCDDNCPTIPNASQQDTDGDGTGDACEANAVLTVSNDPADGADFETVQGAVDAALRPATTVRILPGLGPYDERVRLDRVVSLTLEGASTDPLDPVVIDAGDGTAVFPFDGSGAAHVVRDLTLRGQNGLFGRYDTRIENVRFEANTGGAADLEVGHYRFVDVTVTGGSSNGISLRGSSTAVVERTLIDAMLGFAVFTQNDVTLIDTIIAGSQRGIVTSGADTVVTLSFVTIVDSTEQGIDNAAGATVTIEDSIVYGNLGGDLSGVPCTSVLRSNTGAATGCAGADGNISADPLLDAERRLQTGSPCIDMGLDATTYDGFPFVDIDREPRLADGDGDGTARTDCGADEWVDPSPAIAPVGRVRFTTDTLLEWDAVAGAALYHLYGGDIATLGPTSFGTCQDALDPNLTDTSATILDVPPPGKGDFYLVSAENASGEESILGYGSSSERPNASPCP